MWANVAVAEGQKNPYKLQRKAKKSENFSNLHITIDRHCISAVELRHIQIYSTFFHLFLINASVWANFILSDALSPVSVLCRKLKIYYERTLSCVCPVDIVSTHA